MDLAIRSNKFSTTVIVVIAATIHIHLHQEVIRQAQVQVHPAAVAVQGHPEVVGAAVAVAQRVRAEVVTKS